MFIAVALLCCTVAALPGVAFPFNSQVPPVARIGQPYSFQFATDTFEGTIGDVQYALQGAPAWLSLDSASRTLYGTPQSSDAGAPTFTITASSSAGTADDQAVLVVTAQSAPSLSISIASQLVQLNETSSCPNCVSLHGNSAFNIPFQSGTFEDSAQSQLTYYATMADHAPLPSWLHFDSGSLTFSGITPASAADTQSYSIALIASDFIGFAGASVDFEIAISSHVLSFEPAVQEINITANQAVQVTNLQQQLFLDGSAVDASVIANASCDCPSWLNFNSNSISLTGSAPSNVQSGNASITVADQFGDVAVIILILSTGANLFRGTIGSLNATIGEDFSYQISHSILTAPSESVSVDLGSLGEWLHFDAATLNISGQIPASARPTTATATIIATASAPPSTATELFEIVLSDRTAAATATASSSSTTSTATPMALGGTGDREPGMTKQTRNTIVAILCILIGVAALIIALLYCLRRQKKRGYLDEFGSKSSPRTLEISRPIRHDSQDAIVHEDFLDVEKGGVRKIQNAPQLPVQFTSGRTSRHSKARASVQTVLNEDEARHQSQFDRSSWGFAAVKNHNPHDSMRVPTEMARRSRALELALARMSPKRSKRRSSKLSVGLPSNRRLTGLGHGERSMSSPSRLGSSTFVPYGSQQPDRDSGDSVVTFSTGMLSPSAFPPPPNSVDARKSSARRSSQPILKRSSTRSNAGGRAKSGRGRSTLSGGNLLDSRSMSQKRASYIRHRASTTRSPFFSSAIERPSSSLSSITGGGQNVASSSVLQSNTSAGLGLGLHFPQSGESHPALPRGSSSSIHPPPRSAMRLVGKSPVVDLPRENSSHSCRTSVDSRQFDDAATVDAGRGSAKYDPRMSSSQYSTDSVYPRQSILRKPRDSSSSALRSSSGTGITRSSRGTDLHMRKHSGRRTFWANRLKRNSQGQPLDAAKSVFSLPTSSSPRIPASAAPSVPPPPLPPPVTMPPIPAFRAGHTPLTMNPPTPTSQTSIDFGIAISTPPSIPSAPADTVSVVPAPLRLSTKSTGVASLDRLSTQTTSKGRVKSAPSEMASPVLGVGSLGAVEGGDHTHDSFHRAIAAAGDQVRSRRSIPLAGPGTGISPASRGRSRESRHRRTGALDCTDMDGNPVNPLGIGVGITTDRDHGKHDDDEEEGEWESASDTSRSQSQSQSQSLHNIRSRDPFPPRSESQARPGAMTAFTDQAIADAKRGGWNRSRSASQSLRSVPSTRQARGGMGQREELEREVTPAFL